MTRKLFIHKRGSAQPELIEVEETVTVEELISRHGAEGHSAWAQDGEELVVTELVIDIVEERGHVHIGPHHKIDVTVRFGSNDKEHEYKPGTSVQVVLDWACSDKAFDIPANQRGDMELFLDGSKTPLDHSQLIGVLSENGRLKLYLAVNGRPQG